MKINEKKLQALYDGLRLLMLLSTDEQPFDMVGEVAGKVKWFPCVRLATSFKVALAWLEKQAKKQGYRWKKHDCLPEFPEVAWKIWNGYFTEFSATVTYERKRQRKRKVSRAKPKPKPEVAPKLPGLYDEFPWLSPTSSGEPNDPKPVPGD